MRKNNITLSFKNIISFLRNLNGHFTGEEKIITLCFTILMLSLANITSTSALSYQTETDISFTFNPTISISLSSSDLVIPSLAPGTTSESNSINVSVATNAAYGYTLSATVDNTNLTHTNETNTFGSIATNANLSNLATDNTWGYATSLDSGSTWSNYNGLSNSSNKKLLDIDTNISSTIGFKIDAKASNAQASGTYTNTVNFIAIARVSPKTIADLEYLQDFADLDAENLTSVKSSMSTHQTHTLKDKRDEQAYTIAKLNDDKIWMTKNLNLAGGIEIASTLSDVPEGYTLPIGNGFLEGNKLPESSQEGFNDDTQSYVYNSGNGTNNCADIGCYSYYSWVAATAGSETTPTSSSYALYSICPKGWELPTRNIFDNLKSKYPNFYSQAGAGTAPNFLFSGLRINGYKTIVINGNKDGQYWTSTKRGSTTVLNYLYFDGTSFNISNGMYAKNGLAVRCLAK